MSCTKTVQAVTVVAVIFNGDPWFEYPNSSSSPIIANVTVSGAGSAGIELNYLVDGSLQNKDVGIKDGTQNVRVSVAVPTNVLHTVTILEANTC